MSAFTIEPGSNFLKARFTAMASPCEILFEDQSPLLLESVIQNAVDETARIEAKYSRYQKDNIVSQINSADGQTVEIDDETFRLLAFADNCYKMSEGRFDVTSGVLRRAWDFSRPDHVPTEETIKNLLAHVGWKKTTLTSATFQMPAGMEIDLGGIAKEYAVDRVYMMLSYLMSGYLVNFGGDLRAKARNDKAKWQIGVEDSVDQVSDKILELESGALASSGTTRRFIQTSDGKRYGHILNAKTGWPIEQAPLVVTVAAPTCTEAGMYATFAMLQGKKAEKFLKKQNLKNWIVR